MITTLVLSLLQVSFVVGQGVCRPYEQWTQCPLCEIWCGENPNKPCAMQCLPPGCFCSPQLNLRRRADGICVPAYECPMQFQPGVPGPGFGGMTLAPPGSPGWYYPPQTTPGPGFGGSWFPVQCGANERWTQCTLCEWKCGQNENTPCHQICGPPSCFCSPNLGFRRTSDGRCVPAQQCPWSPDPQNPHKEHGLCGPNEKWKTCRGCEMMCNQEEDPNCQQRCDNPGCHCSSDSGLRRLQNGSCIPYQMCPAPWQNPSQNLCKENEEWTTCSTCEGTCHNPRPRCRKGCRPARCQCSAAKGFVRDNSGNCIRLTECSMWIEEQTAKPAMQ